MTVQIKIIVLYLAVFAALAGWVTRPGTADGRPILETQRQILWESDTPEGQEFVGCTIVPNHRPPCDPARMRELRAIGEQVSRVPWDQAALQWISGP